MNAKFLTIVLTILTSYSFGQTYSFSKLVKKATVQTSSGNQQRIIGTYQGPYTFEFETPSDPQIKRLFTLLNPGQDNSPGLPWYGLLKEQGYIEKDGKLLKKNLYFNTESNEKVMVLIADDYSLIVIIKNDDTIWEFIE
jgi:hypothetical protein